MLEAEDAPSVNVELIEQKSIVGGFMAVTLKEDFAIDPWICDFNMRRILSDTKNLENKSGLRKRSIFIRNKSLYSIPSRTRTGGVIKCFWVYWV